MSFLDFFRDLTRARNKYLYHDHIMISCYIACVTQDYKAGESLKFKNQYFSDFIYHRK